MVGGAHSSHEERNGQVTDCVSTPEELYLDLLKKCLTRSIFGDSYVPATFATPLWRILYRRLRRVMAGRGLYLRRRVPFDPEIRANGLDWPAEAETMIGLRRLDSLQRCIVDVLNRGVPGDLIETGAWRGGATILMRGVLKAYQERGRIVWVADSFQGLPQPDPERYPSDAGDPHWTMPVFNTSLEEVKGNFARYGLLDEQVRFLPGWFKDTLPGAPIERLAVLRLDGDMYGSTMEALTYLYPKLSIGGYAIVDDYGSHPGCRAAVSDFRAQHNIDDEILPGAGPTVFWQRKQ